MEKQLHTGRIIAATLTAWFVYVVVDLWCNAVLFASYWKSTAGYWRPPIELFRLIPIGYAAFALYCAMLTWFLARLYPTDLRVGIGMRFGATLGLVFGGSSALGSFCLFRMPVSALIYLWLWSGMLMSALGAAAAAWVLTAERPWRRTLWAFLAALVAVVLAFLVQSLFFPEGAMERRTL